MVDRPFNGTGFRKTGAIRLRNTFFGAVIEELVESDAGEKRWIKPSNKVWKLAEEEERFRSSGRG